MKHYTISSFIGFLWIFQPLLSLLLLLFRLIIIIDTNNISLIHAKDIILLPVNDNNNQHHPHNNQLHNSHNNNKNLRINNQSISPSSSSSSFSSASFPSSASSASSSSSSSISTTLSLFDTLMAKLDKVSNDLDFDPDNMLFQPYYDDDKFPIENNATSAAISNAGNAGNNNSNDSLLSSKTPDHLPDLPDYDDEDRKYFDYSDEEFGNNNGFLPTDTTTIRSVLLDDGGDKQLIEATSTTATNIGRNCEMLNGSLGECHSTQKCMLREPNRGVFSLCEWTHNPRTGERIPVKLCCSRGKSMDEISNEQHQEMAKKVVPTSQGSGSSGPGSGTSSMNNWNMFGYPPYQQQTTHYSGSLMPFDPSVAGRTCGQTIYNRDHRRHHIQRFVYEIPERIGKTPAAAAGLRQRRRGRGRGRSRFYTNAPRIVSGVSVGSGEIPWIVSIYAHDHFVCGGSLITERHILTAAHCFATDKNPNSYYIRYGSIVLHEGPAVGVARIMIHPGYKPPVIYHDIAMMELLQPVQFSSTVQPACLATHRMYGNNLVGQKCTVSGFGDSNFEGKQSDFLQAVDIRIIENRYCDQNYRRLAESRKKFRYGIGRTLICAGYEQGMKDACQGDSGGPLTIDVQGVHYQIGIVSFGFRCAQPHFPGIYTAVSHYRRWILENIRSTSSTPSSISSPTSSIPLHHQFWNRLN